MTTDITDEIYLFWVKQFKAIGQANNIAVSLPNEAFTPPDNNVAWIELLLNFSPDSTKIARGTYEKLGIASAVLHFPIGQGMVPTNALAKIVIDAYQDAVYLDDILRIISVTSSSGARNQNSFDTIVDINFRFKTSNLGEITSS